MKSLFVNAVVANAAAITLMCLPLASAVAAQATTVADAAAPSTIPFIVGLTTMRVVSTPAGDYESLRVIESIDGGGYRLKVSGEVPDSNSGNLVQLQFQRKVLAADQKAARAMRVHFFDGDDESFPETVPGFSAIVVNELRSTGKASLTYLDVGSFFGVSTVLRELSGTLTRVTSGPTSMPMLVNGRTTQISVIHAIGVLSDGADQENFDFTILNDPANPIMLRSSGAGISSAIVRIDYPQPRATTTSIESALSRNEVVKVYGIYFSFNSAQIRPESTATLKEIAAALAAHPDWKLRVDGHTDNVGNDADNLGLSQRRSAAVKKALVAGYSVAADRLATDGHGESSPQATNATPEGRAQNRRVELQRQ